jgi:hypothetical protein
MLLIAVAAFLAIAGWMRWPWWTPVAAFVLTFALILWSLGVVNDWRREAGLASRPLAEFAVALAAWLALYVAAYWSGRGLRRLISAGGARRPRRPVG